MNARLEVDVTTDITSVLTLTEATNAHQRHVPRDTINYTVKSEIFYTVNCFKIS